MSTKIYRIYTQKLTIEEKEILKEKLSYYTFFVTETPEYLQPVWISSEPFPATLSLFGCPYEDVTANPL